MNLKLLSDTFWRYAVARIKTNALNVIDYYLFEKNFVTTFTPCEQNVVPGERERERKREREREREMTI